ncbi:terminase B [Biomaibacter acetigenes]|uniref:Terminase B n=1 Tax=Biomaibacter acetigenes TaxID=2316383 RepID=A0A3G2R5Z3_9FIRM|nr:DEAD/DEAH box helicase family protein [Biomaibacter acetigenes]AYO30816.1 terminase B [Biomaibacter acetigenes]
MKNELVRGMIQYIKRPVLFVRNVLHAEPDDWQAETLQALADYPRVAVRSGHGVGKTALEAWALLWFLFTRPFPKIPCTAPTREQLHDILWAEAAKWLERAPALKPYFEWQKTKIVQKQYPERWFATARTSNKPENMAGFHEEHLLFIIDEASGVADSIFETIEGALTTSDAKLLMCGNPTKNSGVFHDAFFKDRALYWTRKVSCLDSPRVTQEYAERLKRKYHEDSDVYRVRVLGEFPKAEPDTFIPLDIVEAATMREAEPDGVLEIGVDVARFGDDETVLAARVGLKLVYLKAYSKQDTMVTAGHVIALAKDLMREYGKPKCIVKIDDDGVGGGVTDRLREIVREEKLYIDIVDCHNGGTPEDQDHYENWGTEAWAHLRDLLQEEQIELINDDDLVGQLTTRKYRITSKGKIALETKEEMKKRGLMSPDRADAVVLAFAKPTTGNYDPTAINILKGVKIYG